MNFWKFCIKYEKIQFFFWKFHILWPTTQKSTLRSQNSKISCLDPISAPSVYQWIYKKSKFAQSKIVLVLCQNILLGLVGSLSPDQDLKTKSIGRVAATREISSVTHAILALTWFFLLLETPWIKVEIAIEKIPMSLGKALAAAASSNQISFSANAEMLNQSVSCVNTLVLGAVQWLALGIKLNCKN